MNFGFSKKKTLRLICQFLKKEPHFHVMFVWFLLGVVRHLYAVRVGFVVVFFLIASLFFWLACKAEHKIDKDVVKSCNMRLYVFWGIFGWSPPSPSS